MSRSCLFVVSLAVYSLVGIGEASTKPRNSLAFSCLDSPFISFFAAGPAHRTFPAVSLSLIDPLGRSGGSGTKNDAIPDSHYGPVVEIPEHPEYSKSLALEICNAEQGVYEVKVTELGNEPYVLGVRASAKHENGETLLLHHTSEKERIRQYRFRFRIEEKGLTLGWLDKDDKEQIKIEESEW